eukprot:scaffold264497_cov28-Tisochrysis_lutea.AAC.1
MPASRPGSTLGPMARTLCWAPALPASRRVKRARVCPSSATIAASSVLQGRGRPWRGLLRRKKEAGRSSSRAELSLALSTLARECGHQERSAEASRAAAIACAPPAARNRANREKRGKKEREEKESGTER